MTIADMTPGPTTESGRKWQGYMVSRIRRRVHRERSFGIEIKKLLRHGMRRWRPEDAVGTLADLAGVDWLYDPNTGEVRFFE